jgi:hypothetical protein
MNMRPARALALGALIALTALPALAACGFTGTPTVKADIAAGAKEVRTHRAVTLNFSRAMDKVSVEGGLELRPAATSQSLEWISPQRLRLTWVLRPAQAYELVLAKARGEQGSQVLGMTLRFTTAPAPTVTAVEVDGKALAENQRGLPLKPDITVRFSEAMDAQQPVLALNKRPLTGGTWAQDRRSATFSAPLAAGARYVLSWAETAVSRAAEPPAGAWELPFFTAPALPSNGHAQSGNPMLVQVEDSQPSRPQFGLQQADMVFEYLSEYEISRFTAVYYSEAPPVVGPVRSARLISIALQSAYHGALFSSGASQPVSRLLSGRPAFLGNAGVGFYREPSRYAPHNLMIAGAALQQHRQDFGDLQPNFGVDIVHPDVEWPGATAGIDIDVPLHHVQWHFVPEGGAYTRLDRGTPFVEGASGEPLKAKNVVLMKVRSWTSNIVEDGCCVRGLEFQMVGEGEAMFFTNGTVLVGRWRHASAETPLEFLDAQGNPVPFNTGLTWVHVR